MKVLRTGDRKKIIQIGAQVQGMDTTLYGTYQAVAAVANVLDLDFALSSAFRISVNDPAAKTITFSHVPAVAGAVVNATIKLHYNSGAAITFPSTGVNSVKWVNDVIPVFSPGNIYMIDLYKDDLETVFHGSVRQLGSSLIVYDSATRADSAVSPGVSTSGHNWVVDNGVIGISGNKFYAPNTAAFQMMHIDSGVGNGIYMMKLRITADPSSVPSGLIFRMVDANNFLSLCLNEHSGNAYLYKRTAGGALAQFGGGSYYPSSYKVVDQDYTLMVICNGLQIDCYVDGILRIQHTLTDTDATLFAATVTKQGILLQDNLYRADDDFVYLPI